MSIFKIVVTGDSNPYSLAGGVPGGGLPNVSYRFSDKLAAYHDPHYDTVTYTNISYGGRTIGSFMPSWYTTDYYLQTSDPIVSITTSLALNPDLLIFSFSTNHFANGVPLEEVIYCFKYCIDYLRSIGQKFIFTGAFPRQRLWYGVGVDAVVYQNLTVQFMEWAQAYAPLEYVENYETTYDYVTGYRPKQELLSNDLLHFNVAGHEVEYLNHIDNVIIDRTILSPHKAKAVNFSLKKSGLNISLTGNIQYRRIFVYTSNDRINFTFYKMFKGDPSKTVSLNETFTDNGEVWYKIIIITGAKTLTKTIQIN